MASCPGDETILAFVEDRLRPAERAAVEAHAASCEACSSLLAAVAAAWFSGGMLASPSEPAPLAEGQRVGPYTIQARAGSGSMGDVYRARDERLHRDVALKTLPARFANETSRLARFRQEARAAAALVHPNVLTIFDVGAHEGIPYLVSEWLEGETLEARLGRGALPEREVMAIGPALARGLSAAHEKGIVHRDLKPANIFLCAGGACKILDFGLAKLCEAMAEGDATQPGVLLGTAGYMAPEQVRGLAVDKRADIFALGAVLFEMKTGTRAFGGASAVDRMSATLRDEVPRQEGELGAIIARCLAKNPAERFQSANDLAFSLESLAEKKKTNNTTDNLHNSQELRATPTSGRGEIAPKKEPPAGGRTRTAIIAVLAAAGIGVAGTAGFLAAAAKAPRDITDQNNQIDNPDPHPTYRPITFQKGQVAAARFSADGHTIVFSALWDGGAVTPKTAHNPSALPEIFTARTDSPGSRPLGVAGDLLSISSKGELAVLIEPRYFDLDHTFGTLARIPLGGGAPRAVAADIQEADWNAPGDELAVIRNAAGRFRLEYPIGTPRYETERWISYARVSPRGNSVAFLEHPNPKDDRGSVMVIEDGGTPRALTGEWAGARGLAWEPGGNEVWFTASKTDADFALYAVDVANGRQRVVDRVAGRILLLDVAPGGRALVDHQSIRMGLVFGRNGGGAERELTWSDSSFLTDLSSDGELLAFTETGQGEGSSYGSYLRSTAGAPPVRLGEGQPLAISPDATQVLSMRYAPSFDLSLLPTGAGSPKSIPFAPLAAVVGARWFPDGERILLRGNAAGRVARLWTYRLGTSAPEPITREGVAPVVVISPDGSRLCGVDDEGALRLFSDRGEDLGVVPGKFKDHVAVGWDKTGDAVYLRNRALPVRVSRVNLSTGAAEPHRTLPPRSGWPGLVAILSLSLSADGEAYAYSYYEVLSRLYLVEGLR